MAAPNISWIADTVGGSEITDPLVGGDTGADLGVKTNGEITDAQELYLEHDGANQIINCKFYLAAYSGTYGGDDSPANDLAELLDWGSQSVEDDFGGFQINMDRTGGWATAWPTYDAHSVSSLSYVFETGVGDSVDNAIALATGMGCPSVGVIPSGADPNVGFRCRVQIPTNEDTPGVRQFDLKLRFTFTS